MIANSLFFTNFFNDSFKSSMSICFIELKIDTSFLALRLLSTLACLVLKLLLAISYLQLSKLKKKIHTNLLDKK